VTCGAICSGFEFNFHGEERGKGKEGRDGSLKIPCRAARRKKKGEKKKKKRAGQVKRVMGRRSVLPEKEKEEKGKESTSGRVARCSEDDSFAVTPLVAPCREKKEKGRGNGIEGDGAEPKASVPNASVRGEKRRKGEGKRGEKSSGR